MRIRDSEVTQPTLEINLPFGVFAATTYRSTHLSLRPGDRMVFVTDGMLERNAASSGLPAAIQSSRDLHPREVVRALAEKRSKRRTGLEGRRDGHVSRLAREARAAPGHRFRSRAEPARASAALA